jgi:hypothetical protein
LLLRRSDRCFHLIHQLRLLEDCLSALLGRLSIGALLPLAGLLLRLDDRLALPDRLDRLWQLRLRVFHSSTLSVRQILQ